MLEPILNEYELRVVGSLIEKQIATPDYYPMTLNSLTNACNQKNHRDPVVSYDEATVERALAGLQSKKLTFVFHGSESRSPKYGHLFPKAYDLDEAGLAIMCVLILRGPQTPGELRSRTSHLHQFASLAEVEAVLQSLSSRQDPLIVQLPRQERTRESRYVHLLGGEIDLDQMAQTGPQKKESPPGPDRFARLEAEINGLREELADLKQQFDNFKKQFE